MHLVNFGALAATLRCTFHVCGGTHASPRQLNFASSGGCDGGGGGGACMHRVAQTIDDDDGCRARARAHVISTRTRPANLSSFRTTRAQSATNLAAEKDASKRTKFLYRFFEKQNAASCKQQNCRAPVDRRVASVSAQTCSLVFRRINSRLRCRVFVCNERVRARERVGDDKKLAALVSRSYLWRRALRSPEIAFTRARAPVRTFLRSDGNQRRARARMRWHKKALRDAARAREQARKRQINAHRRQSSVRPSMRINVAAAAAAASRRSSAASAANFCAQARAPIAECIKRWRTSARLIDGDENSSESVRRRGFGS